MLMYSDRSRFNFTLRQGNISVRGEKQILERFFGKPLNGTVVVPRGFVLTIFQKKLKLMLIACFKFVFSLQKFCFSLFFYFFFPEFIEYSTTD